MIVFPDIEFILDSYFLYTFGKTSCSFFLASVVGHVKPDRFPEGNEPFFSGCLQDILSFSVVFKTLIAMCLSLDFFGFNLFIVCSVPWI